MIHMFFLAIIAFLMPIILRFAYIDKSKSWLCLSVLAPTMIVYGIWFFISAFLIIIKIPVNIYLWIFVFVPTFFTINEIFFICKNRKNIKIDKTFLYFLLFLILFIILNLFSFTVFGDSTIYIKLGIDALTHNQFLYSLSFYHFTSFYYLATIFGAYDTQLFYSILVPLIFSIFAFFSIFEILKLRYPNLLKLHYLAFIYFLVLLINHSFYAFSGNWLIGFIIPLFFIAFFLNGKLSSSLISRQDFFLICTTFALLNLSATSLVIGLPFSIFYFLISAIKGRINIKVLFFIPIIIFSILLIFVDISMSNYLPIFVTLWILSIMSFIVLVLYFWKSHLYVTNNIEKFFHFFTILQINIYSFTKSKGKVYAILLLVFIIMFSLEVIFYFFHFKPPVIDNVTPANVNPPNGGGSGGGSSGDSDANTLSIPAFALEYKFFYFCILELITLLFFIMVFELRQYYLFFIFFILALIFASYSIIQILPLGVPNYLSDRVFYSFECLLLFFILILTLNIFEKRKRWFIVSLLPVLTCFSLVNNYSAVNTIFSKNVIMNKCVNNKNDFNFFMKHYSTLYENKRIFSEIETPFLTSIGGVSAPNISTFYYFDRSVYQELEYKFSFFLYLSPALRYQKEKIEIFNNFLSENLKFGKYFQVLLIKINSKYLTPNIESNYHFVDSNGEIALWVKNK